MRHLVRKRTALVVAAMVALAGCSSTQNPKISSSTTYQGHGTPYGTSDTGPFTHLSRSATSKDYGYSQSNPIKTGPEDGGSHRSRLYLNGLRGPDGEPVTFERRGACCQFETSASSLGVGFLDVYDITYRGLEKPIVLYVDLYDQGEQLIPYGFTARRD